MLSFPWEPPSLSLSVLAYLALVLYKKKRRLALFAEKPISPETGWTINPGETATERGRVKPGARNSGPLLGLPGETAVRKAGLLPSPWERTESPYGPDMYTL